MSPDETERALVDTNVFIYAHDPTDPDRQNHALALIARLEGVRYVDPFVDVS
jgi:predicted nucleic acid-binding protein